MNIIGNKEVDDEYIARVKTLLPSTPKSWLRRARTSRSSTPPIHGSGNVPVRRILREIGITNVSVVKEQEAPDPNFSTVKVPNPEDPAAFTLAIKLANEVGADAIFGTDPDCDRLGVAVREKGRQLPPADRQSDRLPDALLHPQLQKAQGKLPANGAVVKSIVSTELARAICKDFGVALFDTLTGFKFIGEKDSAVPGYRQPYLPLRL